MKILGFDSAGKTASVAIWQDGHILYEVNLRAGLTHSQTLLPLCCQALVQTGLSLADIDFLAFNLGPGSFTGLRIGLSTAKGLSFSRAIPCIGVSTLESLAYSLPVEGNVVCALDARRCEVYAAAFSRKGQTAARLCADEAIPVDRLEIVLQNMQGPVYLMGDGAALVQEAFSSKFTFQPLNSPASLGSAAGVCFCAAQHRDEAVQADVLTPDYLRLSQAQRERAQRLSAQQSEQ